MAVSLQGGVKTSDKFYMLVATGARMVLSLATFVVIVRYLGPANFGFYAACIAVASVIAALTDFGLATSSLRAASMDRARSAEIVGDALALKVGFSLLATLIAGGSALLVVSGDEWLVFLLLLVGMIAYSLADLAMVAARVNRQFFLEARIVVLTGIAMFGVVAAVAAATKSLLAVAIAFAATRLGYLVFARFELRRLLQPLKQFGRSLSDLVRTLRSAGAYALDSILTMVSSQIDVIVFATMLTLAELGTYQAGARLVQVIVPFSVMLSSVYLPALSASRVNSNPHREFRSLSGRMTIEFSLLALIGSLMFLLLGPLVTQYIYGPEFGALNQLWPAFAFYVLHRFIASGFGIQLVALGRIRTRIYSQVIAMTAFFIAAFILIPLYGFNAASTVMAAMGLSSFIALGIGLLREVDRHPVVILSFFGIPLIASVGMLIG
ncbi:oligosaccharide flippase family protein [Qipengyuania sp. GH38]|uniref:oligosaccharide flippase family protein n=1 Tax=Qipengyuania intermedia TaxID=2867244 RepID=UPI001C87DEA6|nr:oligosaccharide flippase family protein [Qipengyuania intermedia]